MCCSATTRVISGVVGIYFVPGTQQLCVVTIELSNSGVGALQAFMILASCGAVALPPPERGYLHLWCYFRRAHCCCELRVAYVIVQKATRAHVPVILPLAPFFLAIQA